MVVYILREAIVIAQIDKKSQPVAHRGAVSDLPPQCTNIFIFIGYEILVQLTQICSVIIFQDSFDKMMRTALSNPSGNLISGRLQATPYSAYAFHHIFEQQE